MKKRTGEGEPQQVFLNKPKDKFEKELDERILNGQKIAVKYMKTNKFSSEYAEEYETWHDYNLELIKQSFTPSRSEYLESYKNAGQWEVITPLFGKESIMTDDKRLVKYSLLFKHKLDNLRRLVNKIPLLKAYEDDTKGIPEESIIELDRSKIFIVHGHDDAVKNEVARFVERLGFEAIILHEQASAGKTIIEKIEHYSNVGFGIVLYTPCDKGAKSGEEDSLNNRARQNVVFEHGLLIGKIGRGNVCALVKGEIEKPNDISGVVYISIEGDWKLSLVKEMKNSGYEVDMSLVIK